LVALFEERTMDAASILLILAAAGVNYGWQPAENSAEGYDYVVQIEPELLDVLQRGEAVPIESHVPPEVTPIRKVSIVVGRGDVARTSRDAVNHTAYFAGQAGWAPGSSPPPASAPTYDRYAQPAAAATGVSPPPTVLDRTRTAISESGSTLRDGFEAGVQAANQQLRGWTDDVGQQLKTSGHSLRATTEQTLGVGGNNSQRSNPFAATTASQPATSARSRTGVAPPPWSDPSGLTAPRWDADTADSSETVEKSVSPAFVPMRTESGWTSIGAQVAAPPMMVPQLAASTNLSPLRTSTTKSGPTLTAPALEREPIHSVLTDSSRQSPPPASAADSWATGWSNNSSQPQVTISRSGNDTTSGLAPGNSHVPVQSASPPRQEPAQQAAGNWADLWGDQDPWAKPPQQPQSAAPTQQAASATPPATGNPSGQPLLVSPTDQSSQTIATGNPGQAANRPAAGGTSSLPQTTDQPPWLPLLVVSVTLAGSLGANLFLGWSYMDARQKYRSLVRKTADKFRRATTAA
jgi:hypothetical protein